MHLISSNENETSIYEWYFTIILFTIEFIISNEDKSKHSLLIIISTAIFLLSETLPPLDLLLLLFWEGLARCHLCQLKKYSNSGIRIHSALHLGAVKLWWGYSNWKGAELLYKCFLSLSLDLYQTCLNTFNSWKISINQRFIIDKLLIIINISDKPHSFWTSISLLMVTTNVSRQRNFSQLK